MSSAAGRLRKNCLCVRAKGFNLLFMNFFPHPAIKRLCVKTHNALFHGGWNMPSAIGLEISTACNRRCHYCPQSITPQKQKIVSPEVWETFLKRLEEIKWRGMVTFHSYNEPTLVPGFANYVKALKSRLPHCFPLLFTNGDRPAVIDEAMQAGVFLAIITEHPPFKESWPGPIEQLKKKWRRRIRVHRIDHPHDQAGRIKEIKCEPMTECVDNVEGMGIDVEGYMGLCCVDYEHNYKQMFGNILDKSIKELWYSETALETRRKLAAGIPVTKLCHGCFQTTPQPDPPAVPVLQSLS
jgi:GTP 3',8-cyclase